MLLTIVFYDGQAVHIDSAEFGADGIGAILDKLAAKHDGVRAVRRGVIAKSSRARPPKNNPRSLANFTTEKLRWYRQNVQRRGQQRQRNFGSRFRPEDYLAGAMVIFDTLKIMHLLPSSWVLSTMAGKNIFETDNPNPPTGA